MIAHGVFIISDGLMLQNYIIFLILLNLYDFLMLKNYVLSHLSGVASLVGKSVKLFGLFPIRKLGVPI